MTQQLLWPTQRANATVYHDGMGTLYTIGYAGLKGPEDLRRLVGDQADAIIDVRMSPFSRQPAWGARTRATVEGAGYGYLHLKGLGNKAYKSGGIELLDPEAVELLLDLIRDGKSVAIMCVCKDVTDCHRRTIAELATSRMPDLRVVDL